MSKRKSTDVGVSLVSANKKICEEQKPLPNFSVILRDVLQQSKNHSEHSLESTEQSTELQYQASGVKRALHGTIYQLKLLMLVFKRAFDRKRNFKLATELDDAEKFDDVVIQWESPQLPTKVYYQFLQAKHKSDDSETISIDDLFGESDGNPFSLQKYFKSYQKLKRRFGSECVGDVIICTNINFNQNLGSIVLLPQSVSSMDMMNIFHMTNETKTTLWYKLKCDSIPPEQLDILNNTSDLRMLAKELAKCIRREAKAKIDFTNQLFKKYCHSLASHVFNFTKMTYRTSFFTSATVHVVAFRKALADSLQISESDMERQLRKMPLSQIPISADYIKYCVSNPVPQITNTVKLAKELVAAMAEKKIERRKEVIRENMANFPGNVFELTTDQCVDKVKFVKSFLDPNATLRGNLAQLRDSLQKAVKKSAHYQWNDLQNFTFHLTNFPDIRSETYDDTFKLPNSDTTQTEIEEFFDKLIFATNTPNESDMSAIVAEAFNNTAGMIGIKVDEILTGTYMEAVLNWMKTRNAHWVTQTKAETYFLGLQQKMAFLQLLAVSVLSLMSFQNSEIECANDGTGYLNLIDAFVTDPTKLLLMIKCETNSSSWLNWLKISTAFQQTCGTMLDSGIVYAPLSAIVNLRHNFLLALNSTNPCIVICHCDEWIDSPGVDVLQKELNEFINKTPTAVHKKLILIMDTDKFEHFSTIFTTATTTSGPNICLSNLSESSRKRFLTKKINLCGRVTPLEHVLDSATCSIVNSCEILKLCKSEPIFVGRKFPAPAVHYIDRTLTRSVYSLGDLSSLSNKDMIALSGSCIENFSLGNSVHFLSKTNPLVDYIECTEHNRSRGANVHWLHQLENTEKFIHIRSSGQLGCIENLNILLSKGQAHTIRETELNVTDCNESVSVICAVPGMGKSETLKKLLELVQRSEDNVFIIWLNLIDWTSDLLNRDFNTTDDVLEFLYSTQSLDTQFAKDLLKLCLVTTGRVIVFVDGFDEMIPDYEVQICQLFKILLRTKVRKIYIATRTSSMHVLEYQLNVSPYNMNAFSLDDQINYISNYWKTELDAENRTTSKPNHSKLMFLAKELIHKFNERTLLKEDLAFNGIPLQAQMLGVIYLPWASDDSPNFNDAEHLKMDAYKLYRRFIEEKYSRYFDKIIRPTVPGAKQMTAELRNIYDAHHEKLAFQEVFPLQAPHVIEAQYEDNELARFKDVMAGIGIMYFSAERSLKFVHRTFSEFLVGVFLGKEAKKSTAAFADILREKGLLWHPERKMIRYFFDRHLAEGAGCGAHVAVLNNDSLTLARLSLSHPNNWFSSLDTMGRTPVHLIASYGLRMMLRDHLKFYADAFEINDRLHGWDPVKYAAHIEDWFFVADIFLYYSASNNQLTWKEKSSVLLFAVGLGVFHESIDFWHVIEADKMFEEIIYSVDHEGSNVLHTAFKIGSEETLKFLLENLKSRPQILKKLLLTRDNSRSVLPPMFLLRSPLNDESIKQQKEAYFNIMFTAMKQSLTPTDIKDVIFQTDEDMNTLVHFATNLQNTTMLRKLLDVLDEASRSEIFAWRNGSKATPIDIAMQNSQLEAADMFIQFGSQTSTLTKEEISVLMEYGEYECDSLSTTSSASGLNSEEVLKNIDGKSMDELREYLFDVNTRLRSVLHQAAEDGNIGVVRAILEKLDANSENDTITKIFQMQDNFGRTPLHLAAQFGYVEIVEMMLLSLNGNIKISRQIFMTVDKEGMTIVQMTAQDGHLLVVECIVNHLLRDAFENETEDDKLTYFLNLFTITDAINGYTLLHETIERLHDQISEYVLNIFRNHHIKLMALLLKNTDVTAEEDSQFNSFLHSVRRNNIESFRLIIRSLADSPNLLQTLITSKSSSGLCALHYASCNGYSEFLEILLNLNLEEHQKEAFINHREQEEGFTPLHLSCHKNQIECSRILLKYGANVNIATTKHLESPLHLAIAAGSLEITNLLIENGADIHLTTSSLSPLDLAIIHKHPNIVRRLLEINGSSVGIFGTPFYLACRDGSLDILNIFLEKYGISNCNSPLERQNNRTPLHVAANCNHIAVVHTLLTCVKDGLLIDPIDGNGFTPLCFAADNNNDEMIQLFLKNGANIELVNAHGYSLLLLACMHSHDNMFQKLLQHGASIKQKSIAGVTCLHFAAANGNLEIVKICLSYGLDVESETNCIVEIDRDTIDCLLPSGHRELLLDGRCSNISLKPLLIAAAWGWRDVCHELIKNGATTTSKVYQPVYAAALAENADVELLGLFHGHEDSADGFGRTLLHWTAFSGNLETINYAIRESKLKKAELLSRTDMDGRTPLHCAVALCRKEAVISLLDQHMEIGVPVDTVDNTGHTLLHTALSLNATENVTDQMSIIDELWNRNKTWPSMNSLLFCATASGSVEIMDHFFELGELEIDLNSLDCGGNTCLIFASGRRFVQGSKVILEKAKVKMDDPDLKRFIDQRNFKSSTALHEAVKNVDYELVALLLYYGADPTITNGEGKSPLQVADEKLADDLNNNAEKIKTVLEQATEAFVA